MESSIWDIKQNKKNGRNLLFISCIYEGFRVFEIDEINDLNNKENRIDLIFKKENGENPDTHNAIVYGIDLIKIEDRDLCITSSLYDNKLILWEF